MDKRQCLIILTPGFPADEADSTALVSLQYFVRSLGKLHPELAIHVIAFQYPYKKGHYSWKNAKVHAMGGRNSRGLARVFTWLKVYFTFRKISLAYNVSGILSIWLTECALTGQWLSKLSGIKQLSWVCGQDAKPENKYLKMLKITPENVVFKSVNLVKELQKSKQVIAPVMIPSGIDPAYIDSVATKHKKEYDVIGVGALIPLKNFSLFIELIEALKQEFPLPRAVIIGDGPMKAELQSMIRDRKLEGHVQLPGKLPYDETLAMMKKSRIFLHTSVYEGQGLVLLEALYCGLQVVCFDAGYNHPSVMHVCRNSEEMLQKLSSLMKSDIIPTPVLLTTSDETVTRMMKMFDKFIR